MKDMLNEKSSRKAKLAAPSVRDETDRRCPDLIMALVSVISKQISGRRQRSLNCCFKVFEKCHLILRPDGACSNAAPDLDVALAFRAMSFERTFSPPAVQRGHQPCRGGMSCPDNHAPGLSRGARISMLTSVAPDPPVEAISCLREVKRFSSIAMLQALSGHLARNASVEVRSSAL